MDVNKNSYTFGFAAVMVVLVASLLSVAAISLKPFQDKNVESEKKQNILSTVGIEVSREEAAAAYEKNITSTYVLNNKGEVVEGDAFNVDLGVELKKPADQQLLPVFESVNDGDKIYILPMRGKGLWGPIWGFIALKEDMNTISGAVFDHKSETPGLGAEISLGWFQEPFIGKQIFEGTELVSINVVKGGAKEDDMHAVDGISGGTITADGVTDMLAERFDQYLPFFNTKISETLDLSPDSLVQDSSMAFNLNSIQ
jgi:Na+-transporting NADH:ubiquinone oxidoreductase subunit C